MKIKVVWYKGKCHIKINTLIHKRVFNTVKECIASDEFKLFETLVNSINNR